jgi:isocitrate lyase
LHLDSGSIAKFQRELGAMGYKFQFVTLASFHAVNYGTFQLAQRCHDRRMEACAELQEAEFAAEKNGYSATKHQQEVGTGYFDDVAQVIAVGLSSTTALRDSTEHEQFH